MGAVKIAIPARQTFCVYTHTVDGEVFYVGMGTTSRPLVRSQRSPAWHRYADGRTLIVKILAYFGTAREARDLERDLIRRIMPSCNQTHRKLHMPTVDKMIADYMTIRAEKDRLNKEYKAIIERYDDVLSRMEGKMLAKMLDQKVKHMATEHGTMYIEKVQRATCSDWQAYRQWMIENDALDGLEKRVTQSFIKQYEEDNQGDLPPGITVFKENVARVRKS